MQDNQSIPAGKGGRCVRLTNLPPSCAVVTKFGDLNFLENSGPLRFCNGTDLPLPLLVLRQDYVLEYLVVNRIVVKRVLFKWFKLR